MKSFLSETVDYLFEQHSQNIQNAVFILPSRRAVVFLKRELSARYTHPGFAPQCFSIEEFVERLSSLRTIDTIPLLFETYLSYQEVATLENRENFGSFVQWAPMLLQDFNEVDRYLIDPEKIFQHLLEIKKLDTLHWTAAPQLTQLQQNYLEFWSLLYPLYTNLNRRLTEQGLGYQGLIYREALTQLPEYLQTHKEIPHYFIGFNALNAAEQVLLQSFLEDGAGLAFWDADAYFAEQPHHEASLFLNRIRKWPYYQDNSFPLKRNFENQKNIKILAAEGSLATAAVAADAVRNWQKRSESGQTALVLGEESLLSPVLHFLGPDIGPVNITGGLPLRESVIHSFLEGLLDSWNKRNAQGWYYKDLLTIFSDPVFEWLLEHAGEKEKLIALVQKDNYPFRKLESILSEFHGESGTEQILHLILPEPYKLENIEEVLRLLNSVIHLLKEKLQNNGKHAIVLEQLYRYNELIRQLSWQQRTYNLIGDLSTLSHLFKDILRRESVNFRGEPLQGLQIMGLLESRTLDFERIIITSVNEGVLPAGKQTSSLLPFDVKLQYGLPTYEEKDAVYGYHFYRLLQRASEIVLIYNTATDSLEGGEKSRFIHQLLLQPHPAHLISHEVVQTSVSSFPDKPFRIVKTADLVERIREKASRGFSPSSLSAYVRNPLQFYRENILGIQERSEVEEDIASNTFGTVLHNTLEKLYSSLRGKILTKEHLNNLREHADAFLAAEFETNYIPVSLLKGKNLIGYHIARDYLKQFFNWEEQRLENGDVIEILHIEKKFNIPFSVPALSESTIYLRGTVDRIERVNGELHILDYKTGSTKVGNVEIVNMEDLIQSESYNKALQLLCYALLFTSVEKVKEPVKAAIYSFKNSSGNPYVFQIKPSRNAKNGKNPFISHELLEEFQVTLGMLITEIFNPDIPFLSKEEREEWFEELTE